MLLREVAAERMKPSFITPGSPDLLLPLGMTCHQSCFSPTHTCTQTHTECSGFLTRLRRMGCIQGGIFTLPKACSKDQYVAEGEWTSFSFDYLCFHFLPSHFSPLLTFKAAPCSQVVVTLFSCHAFGHRNRNHEKESKGASWYFTSWLTLCLKSILQMRRVVWYRNWYFSQS